MKTKTKPIEPIPDEFDSYDEAAKFWDTHDTTDYLDVSRPVTVASEFRGRYYEIKIEASVAQVLRARAEEARCHAQSPGKRPVAAAVGQPEIVATSNERTRKTIGRLISARFFFVALLLAVPQSPTEIGRRARRGVCLRRQA